MGMDVIGRNPSKDAGKYFRNNVWWWHPLWEYCHRVAPEICEGVLGHSNDGDGLPADGARKLAAELRAELAAGRTEKYAAEHEAHRISLPRRTCDQCGGCGIRSDDVGRNMGMPERELTREQAEKLGRSSGWCNGCGGGGRKESWEASYFFGEENVRAFADFLEHCGGFRIY